MFFLLTLFLSSIPPLLTLKIKKSKHAIRSELGKIIYSTVFMISTYFNIFSEILTNGFSFPWSNIGILKRSVIYILKQTAFSWFLSVFNYRKNLKRTKPNIFVYIFHYLCILTVVIPMFIQITFGEIDFDQLEFHLHVEVVTKGSIEKVISCFKICFVEAIIVADMAAYLLYYIADEIVFPGKQEISIPVIRPLSMFLLLLSCLKILISQPLFIDCLQQLTTNSDFIEKNYIWPEKSLISVPEKKKNLVLLVLESFETTFTSKKDGGFFDVDKIPDLTRVAKENLHFSSSYKLGGGYCASTTGYTIGANFAMLTGLPLKDVTNVNKTFVPNAYSCLDYLRDIGYKNYYFGSCNLNDLYKLDVLYKTHGNSTVYAAEDLKELYPQYKNDINPWGVYDYVTFHAVKDFLKERSNNQTKDPFAVVVGTIDTHFPYGYLCKLCKNHNPGFRYLDTYECVSKQVSDFLDYAKTLPIYNDTVFIIVGDHISMSVEMEDFVRFRNSQYRRRIYNALVNVPFEHLSNKITKKRVFNSFDWYPTILSAMGFKIKGERLGLGTNLFSGMKTLSEKYGMNEFDRLVQEPTTFIKEKILLNKDEDIDVEIKGEWNSTK